MRHLSLGISPCPNDTAIFYGLISGHVSLPGISLRLHIEDVDTLNHLAATCSLDITKVSLYAYGHLRQDYVLLRSGAALGRGCGPLVVAREPLAPECLPGLRIAVPGRLTTASLLLQVYGVAPSCLEQMPFHAIETAVASGKVDAGVLIHEARFTCESRDLVKVLDLGIWWEALTGLPLPLGGIIAKRRLGYPTLELVEQAIGRSIDRLYAEPAAAREFIRSHAQESDDEVLDGHIGLYVNEFTRNFGEDGEAAIEELFARAEAKGLLSPCPVGLFG
jgi:1,4-dihydroxy-6-naphthoate synthase